MQPRAWIILVGIIIFSSIAQASYISITSYIDTFAIDSDGNGYANISIANNGDEKAKNVRMELLLPDGFAAETAYAGDLEIGERFSWKFPVNASNRLPGSYTYALKTTYQDGNGHDFSAISPGSFYYIRSMRSPLSGFIESAEITETGSADIKMKIYNNDYLGHNISVKLFIPQEFSSRQLEKIAEIGSQSEYDMTINVKNDNGLVGSNYPIFASLDFDSGSHYSSYINGYVAIKKYDPASAILVIATILTLLLIAANLPRRAK